MCKRPKDIKTVTVKFGIIPPKDFLAITWFGTMYINKRNKDLWEKEYTDAWKQIILNHENIHLKQAQREGSWIKFYAKYLWYWLKNMFLCGFKNNIAYYCIPYEIEAYQHERNFNYDLEKFYIYQQLSAKITIPIYKNSGDFSTFKKTIKNMF